LRYVILGGSDRTPIIWIQTPTRRELIGGCRMCRNIKTLFNFEPPATDAEVRDASLQFVRKLCGFTRPS
jgi:hypothetical protein